MTKTPLTAQPMAEKDIAPPPGVVMGELEPPSPTQPLSVIRKASRWLRGDQPSRAYQKAVITAAESDIDPGDAILPPATMLIESRRFQRHFARDVRGYRRYRQALADLEEARKMREQADAMPRGDTEGARARTVLAAPGVAYVDDDKRARQAILNTATTIETDAFGHLADLTVDATADKRAALTRKREAAEAKLRILETTVAWVKRRDSLLEKLFDDNLERLTPMAREECEKALDTCEAELGQRRGVDTAEIDCEACRQKIRDLDSQKAALANERFESPKYNWLLAIRQ